MTSRSRPLRGRRTVNSVISGRPLLAFAIAIAASSDGGMSTSISVVLDKPDESGLVAYAYCHLAPATLRPWYVQGSLAVAGTSLRSSASAEACVSSGTSPENTVSASLTSKRLRPERIDFQSAAVMNAYWGLACIALNAWSTVSLLTPFSSMNGPASPSYSPPYLASCPYACACVGAERYALPPKAALSALSVSSLRPTAQPLIWIRVQAPISFGLVSSRLPVLLASASSSYCSWPGVLSRSSSENCRTPDSCACETM